MISPHTLTQDDIECNIRISCSPPSGSLFQMGDTEVECSATDEAGNTETESLTVRVNQTSSPPIPTAKQIIDRPILTIQDLDDDNIPQSEKNDLTAVSKPLHRCMTIGIQKKKLQKKPK